MEKRQVRVMTQKAYNHIMNGDSVQKDPVYKLGIFHEWEQFQEGDYSAKKAIVELEDGSVIRCDIDEITFTKKLVGSNMFEEGLEQ